MPESTAASPFGLLRLPGEIRFGAGAVAGLVPAVTALGRRVLACADPFIAGTDAFRQAIAALEAAGAEVLVVSEFASELPLHEVEACAARANDFAPEVVLGFGGGSSLDLAKLLALLVRHPGPVSQYYGENQVPGPVVPLVAVPTTAGTGSEVTPVAVLADPGRALKVGVSDHHLIPHLAVVDPELTVGAPAAVTAHSGIDALVHAVESFTARRRSAGWTAPARVFVGRNELSAPLSLEAARLIHGSLRTAVSDGADLPAREAMARGSLLAGMAFGTGGTHLSHAIQYPVGAMTKTPHGLGTGLLLPYVVAALRPVIDHELAELAAAMGLEPTADAAVDGLRSLVADIGIPTTLADLGLTAADLPRVVDLTLEVGRLVDNAPVPDGVEVRELVTEIAAAAVEGRTPRPLA
ncbi:iron-containing alcohol dehydrogenase [Nocardioides sp. DS6]|uniref:Iron-containing alcohol dehydrogenase n=1 Tax=Nocardioides eburneus TaxID=3231482 RepID=A0ABV3T0A7_9ACTN